MDTEGDLELSVSKHLCLAENYLQDIASISIVPFDSKMVSGVVGRAELLSAVAFLCALLYYIHNRYQHKTNAWQECGVTSVLAILGLLCKEQALTVLAVCCIYEIMSPKIAVHRKDPTSERRAYASGEINTLA
ncbi:transmembrane and TPR repeat-containing protein 3 [Trichonephila clavipes]|nr:transmembrane and TPR repeat-containing protein 3 [Trichonephila clavipes]